MLDLIDRKILIALQRDATLPMAELAQQVGLSQTPCWKRVKKLEADGVIRGRVALVDRSKVGLPVTVFVSIKTNQHGEDWLTRFAANVSRIPEVVEFHRMSGDVDYLLKIVCADIADYDRVYKRLIRDDPLYDVSSSFAMEELKSTTEIPV
jgi:Lrp/AsnC family transcriptional regulator